MKKIITFIGVIMMVVFLAACSTTSSYTTTTTTTTTDADGNTTTESTTTTTASYPEGSCGALAMDGESHGVLISIENATDSDITGFYMCEEGAESWSNAFEEGTVLAPGETLTDFGTLTYSLETLNWEIGMQHKDGEIITYDASLPIATLDANGFTISFSEDGWNVDAKYCK